MIMNWLFYFLRNLPHGLYTADTDVCLFVKDLDKKSREFEVSEEHFSDMLVEKGVNCVRKVITCTEVYISGVWLSVISTLSTTVIRSVKRWIYVNWLKGLSVKKVRSQWLEPWQVDMGNLGFKTLWGLTLYPLVHMQKLVVL